MNIFMPSNKVLETICWNEKSTKQYTFFPPPYNEPLIIGYFEGLSHQIPSFYKSQFKMDFNLLPGQENFNGQRLVDVFLEAAQNAYAHGNASIRGLNYLILLAEKGICHGFQDWGSFFKRHDIKEKFENKIHPEELNHNIKVEGTAGGRFGLDLIFCGSDKIEIDTKKGILYCVQFIDKMIKQ